MISLSKFDWNTGQDVPFPVNEKAVEKFVNFFLNSKAWHDDIELVHKKVTELRRGVEAEPQVMLAAAPLPVKPKVARGR